MLDHLLLQRVLANCGSTKNAFVPMPGGQAEPVAGASQATAAMGAPLGSPPGGPAPQPAQGGQPPAQGGGGGMPPEVQEMLADPNVQQMLQQAGFAIDPSSGNVIDPATGQPVPPDQLMQILEQLMQGQGQGGGQPPSGGGQPPPDQGGQPGADPSGAQAAQSPPAPDQMSQMVQLLTEIRDHLGNAAKDGKGKGEKKQSVEEMIQGLTQEVQRQGETLKSMTGQQ